MDVKDLISYNHTVRGLYFDALQKLPWTAVIESRGLSFDSLRNVFLHLTLVEDRWVSYVIPDRFRDWVDPDFDAFKNIDLIREYLERVQNNTQLYLARLSKLELNRQIVVPWGEKPYAKLKVEDLLTHMVLEDMIHYGELSAALWQIGVEAPYMGFWRYQHQKR